jgi:ribose 5-phosphate isomerase B
MSNPIQRRTLLAAGSASIASAATQSAGVRKPSMKLAIGSDHAGYPMKGPIVEMLRSWGHAVKDCGSHNPEPVDFPDIAAAVCAEVTGGRAVRGIMVCGTGIGASIAANKVKGIRAALCHDTYSAHQSVEHDNANVLCLGAWIIGSKVAEEILRACLGAEFSASEEFRRRVRKLGEMERRQGAAAPPGGLPDA